MWWLAPTVAAAVEPIIVNGEVEDGYPSAVGLGAAGFTLCSGSLLTPRMVLTAAHCSADFPIELVVQLGSAYFGTDPGEPDGVAGFVDAHIHPDYVPLAAGGIGGELGENDVAVLVLDQDAPVQPVWIRTENLKPDQTAGEEVISVGFGLDENGQGNVKRSAPLVVGYVDTVFLYSYSSLNENEANICSGDSGGPQYHVEEDGTLVQWAVHSWGDTNCLVESGSTRVDKVSNWILDQVEEVHGTRDRCEIFGQYGDGVCQADCESPDPDCPVTGTTSTFSTGDDDDGGGEAASPAAPGEEKGCGCAGAPGGLGGLAWIGVLAVGRRRR